MDEISQNGLVENTALDEHVDYWISQSICLPAQNGTRLWSPDS